MSGSSDATPVFEAQKRASPELKAVADFLRGKNGPKIRRGILNGKRVDYFKGKTAIRTLTGPAYAKLKKVPEVKDEEAAKALLARILPHAFFLRVDRPTPDPPPPSGSPKLLQLAPQQSLQPDAYYAWFYDGSPLTTLLGAAAMVLVMLAGVMFPLWPVSLRIGVWYLSVAALGVIGLFIALAVVRLILWCITVITMKRAIWIFPNLFEDVGFVDSFIPLWAYDQPKKKKKRAPGTSSKSKRSHKPTVSPPVETESPDIPIAAESSATDINPPTGVAHLKQRQSATVEEIEDDEM